MVRFTIISPTQSQPSLPSLSISQNYFINQKLVFRSPRSFSAPFLFWWYEFLLIWMLVYLRGKCTCHELSHQRKTGYTSKVTKISPLLSSFCTNVVILCVNLSGTTPFCKDAFNNSAGFDLTDLIFFSLNSRTSSGPRTFHFGTSLSCAETTQISLHVFYLAF